LEFASYIESPIPSLFKERQFVFLSRFCHVRHCIVRHCGFLVGYGHSSCQLEPVYEGLAAIKGPIDWHERTSAGAVGTAEECHGKP
jgi:hypothetical protein